MNSIFTDYAHVKAPAGFISCIHIACRQAAARPARRIVSRTALILAAAFLLIAALAAAAVNYVPADLFNAETGFMLPSCEWGSSEALPRPQTLTFNGYVADLLYEYENDGLSAVSLIFTTQNQPSDSLPSDLPDQLAAEMTRLFGPPDTIQDSAEIDAEGLRQALRAYLGYSDPAFSEAEKIRSSLLEAGADSELANRAYESVSNSDHSVLLYRWMHKPSSTATYLTVSLTAAQEIHTLKLSLACFER